MSVQQYQQEFQSITIQRKYKLALELIDKLIAQGVAPQKIMTDIIATTLQSLQKFDESPDASGYSSLTLLAIARICDDSIKKLIPLITEKAIPKGKVVIGTPLNDFHTLGKTIISAILRSSGWNVVDLGSNVDAKVFIETAKYENANYILVSAFLLPSALRCKEIADLLKSSKSWPRIRLIVGGPPFKFHFGLTEKLGCDGMGVDAFDAIRVLNRMSGLDQENRNKNEKLGRFDKFTKRIFGLFKRRD